MVTKSIERAYFSVTDSRVSMYDTELVRKDDGTVILNGLFSVLPGSVTSAITDYIHKLVVAKVVDEVDRIDITPLVFCFLYMEGTITVNHMRHAQEDSEIPSVIIYDVSLCDRVFDLAVVSEDDFFSAYGLAEEHFVAVDNEDEVVPLT